MIGKALGEMATLTLSLAVLPCYLAYGLIKRATEYIAATSKPADDGKKPSTSEFETLSVTTPVILGWESEQSPFVYDMAASIAELVKSREHCKKCAEETEKGKSTVNSCNHTYH